MNRALNTGRACLVFLFLAFVFSGATRAAPTTPPRESSCISKLFNLSFDPHLRFDANGRPYFGISEPDKPGFKIWDWTARRVGRPFGITKFLQAYERMRDDGLEDQNAFERLLRAFYVDLRVSEKALDRIPKGVPLIVAANHPRAGIDSISVAAAIARRRSDVRLMFGQVWEHVPEFKDYGIFANPFESAAAQRNRVRAFIAGTKHVRSGSSLVLHPAGALSYRASRDADPLDPPWQQGTVMMARKTGAWVLPVYVDGEPSELYQKLRRRGSWWRGFLLIREMLNQFHSTVRIGIGDPIPPEMFQDESTSEAQTLMVREALYRARARVDE